MSDTTETETETDTNTNTDTTDESTPTKAELHERVEQLESTVEQLMPSRRDALKLGAAGLVGAAGLSAASQSADASTGAAGTIGSSSDRPDAFLDEANVNQLTGVTTGATEVIRTVDFSSSQILDETITGVQAGEKITAFGNFLTNNDSELRLEDASVSSTNYNFRDIPNNSTTKNVGDFKVVGFNSRNSFFHCEVICGDIMGYNSYGGDDAFKEYFEFVGSNRSLSPPFDVRFFTGQTIRAVEITITKTS